MDIRGIDPACRSVLKSWAFFLGYANARAQLVVQTKIGPRCPDSRVWGFEVYCLGLGVQGLEIGVRLVAGKKQLFGGPVRGLQLRSWGISRRFGDWGGPGNSTLFDGPVVT